MVVVQGFTCAPKTLCPRDLHNKLTNALFAGSCFQARLAWLCSCGKGQVIQARDFAGGRNAGAAMRGRMLRKQQSKLDMLGERTELLPCLKR